MVLLDTDAFSWTSPVSGFSAPEAEAWRRWVVANADDIHFSVVTILEVRYGLEKARSKGATRKAELIALWLATGESVHRGRWLPVTTEIAHDAGARLWRAAAAGRQPSTEDALIAATAHHHGLTLISRNKADMAALGADFRDPLDVIEPF
jgi:predicted nucleic acid-binding protein